MIVFLFMAPLCDQYSTALPGNQPHAKRCKREPVASGKSVVLDKLLELVGRGDAHAQTVAEIARAVDVESSHTVHPKLQQLAACGGSGKHDGNTARDFQRFLRGFNGFNVEPYTIKLTLQVLLAMQKESFYLNYV